MDSEMVMEVPDTPERVVFTRSVGESSSHTRRIEDKQSSSIQHWVPKTRSYSRPINNSGVYDFSADKAVPVDGDFLSSQARIDRFISGAHDTITTHSPDSHPQPVRSGVLNDSGISPEMIDLSQESPSPLSYPTRHRGPRHKEESYLSRKSERNECGGYGKFGVHDVNGDNPELVDDDFLFSQARIAQSISDTHDTKTTYSHDSSSVPGRSSLLNNGTSPEMIDLCQGSTFPLSYPTRHRGPRHKDEKYLSRQSKRNEINIYGNLGVRAVISTEGLGKEGSNAKNSSKAFGSSNNIIEAENVRCQARVVSSHKEKVIVQQLNSRTRNDKLQSRYSKLSFQQSIMQQNKLPNGCMSSFNPTNNNNQAKADCKDIKNPADRRAPSSFGRNLGTEIGNVSCKVSQSTTGPANHNHPDVVLHPKKNGHRMLVRNGCISPSNIARKKNDSKAIGIAEEGVIANKLYNGNSSQSTHLEGFLHQKNNWQKNLVHNGSISSSNSARNNNDARAKGFEEGDVISSKMPNGNSSKFIHGSSFEGRMTDKGKGKEIVNEELLANSQHSWTIPTSRRSCLIPGKELTISKMDYDTDRTIDGCGATQKHTGTSSLLPSSYDTCISTSENMSSHLSSSRVELSKGGTGYALSVANEPEVQSGENITQVQGYFNLDSEAPQHIGKRKNSFAHSNAGECSSSTVDSSRKSYERRSEKPLYSRSIRSRKSVRVDTALAPIVEIDELASNTKVENHELSDESFAKSIQLESDEVLARQLQEQFYLESPPMGATEEVMGLHAFVRRENHSLQREALLPSLLGGPRFHPQFTRVTARARARTENGLGHIRRNISRPRMSFEERLDFLEALEAVFENVDDMDIPDHFLDIQRDFDENDYEMLLALDDNNHHVGASDRQINNLPQSLIQNSNSDEACAVCLETPSVGDTIRHLPCLHKFHSNCIDTWLRRKRSCPICKCGIT